MNSKNINVKGRMIGGLLDDLTILCGTKFDNVNNHIEKYKKDGFIWYLDICTLSAESVRRSLFQLKNAGWFKYAKAIVFGRPIFQDDSFGISYQENIYEELKELKVPVICDINLGHIPPSYHFINGMMASLTYNNGIGEINYLSKGE